MSTPDRPGLTRGQRSGDRSRGLFCKFYKILQNSAEFCTILNSAESAESAEVRGLTRNLTFSVAQNGAYPRFDLLGCSKWGLARGLTSTRKKRRRENSPIEKERARSPSSSNRREFIFLPCVRVYRLLLGVIRSARLWNRNNLFQRRLQFCLNLQTCIASRPWDKPTC